MVGRLIRTADFERVLKLPSRARTAHFALHHAAALPSGSVVPDLSTAEAPVSAVSVDNLNDAWLGTVVPKRHAKRAVTRSLVKRQMRLALQRHAGALPGGLWVLRLRQPFARDEFPSASSCALRRTVRGELDVLLQRAAARS